MSRRILLLLILGFLSITFCYPVLAANEDDFWVAWQRGDYAAAGESAKQLGTTITEYYLLAAVCYRNTYNYEAEDIYQNKFRKLGDPAGLKTLLESKENAAQDEPQLLYLEGIIAVLFPEAGLGDPRVFLEKAAAKLKDNPYLFNYLALNELNNRNYPDAQKYLQRAISLKKDFPEPYNNLATVLAQNKETEKAITILLECLNNCPAVSPAVYESLISLASATESVTIKPYNQSMLIVVPVLKEQYCQKIRAGLSKNPVHLLGLAELFIMKGSVVSARSLLAGIDFGDSSLYTYIQLQMAQLDGNFEQATAMGSALLSGNDLNYRRLFEAGSIFFFGKDFNKAVAFYEAALNLTSPDDLEYLAKIYTNLGTCFYLSQEYQKALVNLEKALEYNPQDPGSLVYLGLTYRDSGDKAKAVEVLTKAVENIRDPGWRQEITEIINELQPPEPQQVEAEG